MTPADFVARLRERGVALVLDGGDLRCTGPGEVLTPEVLDVLRAHKPAIVAALTLEAARTPGPCLRCGGVAWTEYGAARLASGAVVCGDCETADDVEVSLERFRTSIVVHGARHEADRGGRPAGCLTPATAEVPRAGT